MAFGNEMAVVIFAVNELVFVGWKKKCGRQKARYHTTAKQITKNARTTNKSAESKSIYLQLAF